MPTQTLKLIDCLAGLKELASNSVKVVVCSPPYNIHKEYAIYQDNLEQGAYLTWLAEVWVELARVLADDGHFFLQVGGTCVQPLLPFEILETTKPSFKLQNLITWVKSISIGDVTSGHFKPINSKRFINATSEYIFHCTKTAKVPIDRLSIGVPYMDQTNVTRWSSGKTLRCQGNTWYIPYKTVQSKSAKFNHPATFPLELPLRCIKLSGAKPGDLILDPFAGIGTTLLAASQLGLDALGFDIDPTYVKAFNSLTEI